MWFFWLTATFLVFLNKYHDSKTDSCFLFPPLMQGEASCCYWHLLTFKSINSVMDLGVTKQLDFEDLIQLPNEMNPSSCYDTLLRCWVGEQSKHCNQPSLFRAICHAYGWPYICLGLLKVLQFCILHDECLLYWCKSITWFLAKLFH